MAYWIIHHIARIKFTKKIAAEVDALKSKLAVYDVTPGMHVGLRQAEFKNPSTMAEYVAGQLISLNVNEGAEGRARTNEAFKKS